MRHTQLVRRHYTSSRIFFQIVSAPNLSKNVIQQPVNRDPSVLLSVGRASHKRYNTGGFTLKVRENDEVGKACGGGELEEVMRMT